MVGEGIETDLAPGFSIERRNVIKGQRVALRLDAAIDIEQQNCAAVAPGRGVILPGRGDTKHVTWISRKLYRFLREKSGGLMGTVAGAKATPAVDDKPLPDR